MGISVMTKQMMGVDVCLATIYNRAGELLLRSSPLGASLDSWDGSLRPHPLLALGQVENQEMLGGKGCVTTWTRDCLGLVILRPGVGVVGALVNAQLSCILWTIVHKYLLVLENVLGGPSNDHGFIRNIH